MVEDTSIMIERITFNHSEWLWLIAILVIIYTLFLYYGKQDKNTSLIDGLSGTSTRVRHPLYKFLSSSYQQHSNSNFTTITIYWLILVLLVIALSEPIQIGKKLPEPPRQRDIVFIVDTSVSMVLKDYTLDEQRVDRMSVVRATLKNFIDALKGDKVSIIAFADTAHVLVPLTSDVHLLKSMLLRLRTGIAGRGSAPGDAIALAVKQIIKHKRRHQIMILLTDAALPIGSIKPIQAANIAANADLPLYTVAVGADTYSAEEKRKTGLIYHPADRILLAKMASLTGAQSYLAGNSVSLQTAIKDIEQLEFEQQKTINKYYRHSLYQWPLLLALSLLTLFQVRHLVFNRGKSR